MPDRAGNSGGARDPSSQKPFGLAQSFSDFEVVAKLNSNMFLRSQEILFFARFPIIRNVSAQKYVFLVKLAADCVFCLFQ